MNGQCCKQLKSIKMCQKEIHRIKSLLKVWGTHLTNEKKESENKSARTQDSFRMLYIQRQLQTYKRSWGLIQKPINEAKMTNFMLRIKKN